MDLLAVTYFLNGMLMVAIPILLGIYLTNRFRIGGKIWWIGACIFIISQILHIPFNLFILNPLLPRLQQGTQGLLIIAGLLGLSAGIFEETARYGMYRWWLKDSRTWRSAILAGAGHGGIEAIIFGVLVIVGYLNMMAYRNLDLGRLSLALGELQIASLQAYWSAPWYATLLGAVERAFTIPVHIAASVLVLQVFTRGRGHQRLAWLGLAIFFHAVVDASAYYIFRQWGVYISEAAIGVMAVMAVIIIFGFRQPEAVASAPEPVAYRPPAFTPTALEETSDNLEKTRFQ
jgi:uncharacterized membrane protein YhfC